MLPTLNYALHECCPKIIRGVATGVYGYIYPLQKNKEIVDSRLRPQWCFHLGNVTEMEEMLDCKLDALIWSFAWENN